MAESNHHAWTERARELQTVGLQLSHAIGTAWLEKRVSLWPEAWGNSLRVLVYGDFQAPTEPLVIPSLGITVLPEKQEI